jgi:hypothetical protein
MQHLSHVINTAVMMIQKVSLPESLNGRENPEA